jgi:hypothetical protein
MSTNIVSREAMVRKLAELVDAHTVRRSYLANNTTGCNGCSWAVISPSYPSRSNRAGLVAHARHVAELVTKVHQTVLAEELYALAGELEEQAGQLAGDQDRSVRLTAGITMVDAAMVRKRANEIILKEVGGQ